ncbi:hypothetical protein GCM10022243_48110 [Saccharothrix violaceirubra]|uniref:TP901 family phage tail tape measure protein n=1 Tax=Saccharothrix violaceirubra TaxID=413306 RepID=A0A7W7SZI7_9PSEU|nr:phage tail tape measure protein [Saccharothrix violaceirubra]MBB4963847.1 TP901 family phage tail tape measure protein [Saccharothrix violaceirubra]
MAGGRIDIEVAPDLSRFPGDLSSGLKAQTGLASSLGRGLGLAVAAGATVAAVGLKKVIDLGVQYTANLNELQAVTSATGFEMARVGETAKALGADISLPGTSAADAAAAMKELAKGGLDVNEAMTAAKGTLQLAAAAQVEAAQAAEIQSDALNQFGLAADQAGHVADVLANTANAASGEITDVANALKYVGPVAKTVGVDIDNVATAIGVVATQGIRGEQAGTSLRGVLASLAAPSKPAAEGLKALGIEAFTAEGKFVGLRAITEQLAAAKGRLSEAEFTAAAATAFGNEGLTVASALASSGAAAFDSMAGAVTRAGGAADVAAAKTKGLGGAWEGFKSQAETFGIEIFEAIDGPLEQAVRAATDQLSKLGPAIADGIDTAVAVGELYGPRIAAAIEARADVVAQAGRDVLGPLVEGAIGPLNAAVNTALGLWGNFTGVLDNAVDAAAPAAQGLGAVAQAAADGDGPVSALASGLGLVGDAAQAASGLLVPIGEIVGVIAAGFAALPGPVQSAAVAMGLVAAFRGPLTNLGTTVRDRVTMPFQRLNETVRLQQALLTGSTQIATTQVGRLGLAFAALEARVPVIGRMADSYRTASTAAQGFVTQQSAVAQVAAGISGQYTGVANVIQRTEGALRATAGAAAGTAAALGTGLQSAATGLVGALGGPFGVAIAAASVGLSLIADRQAKAAQQAQQHASQVDSLTAALVESNGAITESVRAAQAKTLQGTKVADTDRNVADAAREAGISLSDLTDATLGNGTALDGLRHKLEEVVKAGTKYQDTATGWKSGQVETVKTMSDEARAAESLLGEINKLADVYGESKRKQEEFDRAVREGRASIVDATSSGRALAGAMTTLSDATASADDKARALKNALDALSGGQIDLEEATFQVEEVLDRLGETFNKNTDKSKGWGTELNNAGAALIKADGSINGATQNGRLLRDTLESLTEASASVAQSTYDMAIAQGDSVPTATAKATAAVKHSRDAFIALAEDMGLSATEAANLATKAGLIPENVAILVSTPGSDKTRQELIMVKGLADALPPDKPITVRSLSDEAKAKLIELGYTVVTTPNSVTITANSDKAQQQLNAWLSTPATKTVYVNYVLPGNAGSTERIGTPGTGGLAAGGIVAAAYASGGVHKLTPMRAGLARIVPPNTWRIVGDRVVDDEAYIPINSSVRSASLLAETASRMGYDLIRRFAVGGFARGGEGSGSAPVLPGVDGWRISGELRVNGLDGHIDGRIGTAMDRAGTALTRRTR